jgi:hypothetical protein
MPTRRSSWAFRGHHDRRDRHEHGTDRRREVEPGPGERAGSHGDGDRVVAGRPPQVLQALAVRRPGEAPVRPTGRAPRRRHAGRRGRRPRPCRRRRRARPRRGAGQPALRGHLSPARAPASRASARPSGAAETSSPTPRASTVRAKARNAQRPCSAAARRRSPARGRRERTRVAPRRRGTPAGGRPSGAPAVCTRPATSPATREQATAGSSAVPASAGEAQPHPSSHDPSAGSPANVAAVARRWPASATCSATCRSTSATLSATSDRSRCFTVRTGRRPTPAPVRRSPRGCSRAPWPGRPAAAARRLGRRTTGSRMACGPAVRGPPPPRRTGARWS